jgi:hypothetical protein
MLATHGNSLAIDAQHHQGVRLVAPAIRRLLLVEDIEVAGRLGCKLFCLPLGHARSGRFLDRCDGLVV